MASSGAQISSGSKLEITQDLCQTATLCCSAGRPGAAGALLHTPTHPSVYPCLYLLPNLDEPRVPSVPRAFRLSRRRTPLPTALGLFGDVSALMSLSPELASPAVTAAGPCR